MSSSVHETKYLFEPTGEIMRLDKSISEILAERHIPEELQIREEIPDLPIIPEKIIRDYNKFWKYCGGVAHPRKRDKEKRPIRVLKPAWYQTKFAEMNHAVWLSSNKMGKTMGESINDVRSRLMPEHAGFDVLLVGQNQLIADQHLLDLKVWMLGSDVMRPYLITKPNRRFVLPEQKSKMSQMYVENPYYPSKPSRIIAIGFSESLAYSWKNIDKLHISDPAMIKRKDQLSFFSGLYSRLSNTEGDIKIEGVAGERLGYFWELCKVLFNLDNKFEQTEEHQLEEFASMKKFDKMFTTADDGLKEGIITQDWLDFAKTIMTEDEFKRIYYGVFAKPEGAIFGDWKIGTHQPLGLDQL
jgi:hypothetical protein